MAKSNNLPFNNSAHFFISPSPGKNTNTSPSFSFTAFTITCEVVSGNKKASPSPTYLTSTGYCFPSLTATGQFNKAVNCGMFNVADITIMRKSGLNICCASRHKAMATSANKLRSWNSSKITKPTFSNALSVCNMRVKIPSVTTSIFVCVLTLFSKRIL